MRAFKRRRKLWLVTALLVGVFAAGRRSPPGATSPDATGLGERVQARLRATGGRPVVVSRVAPWLRDAVVATEDERFYRHHGVDLIGVLRALPYDLVHLSFAQGASTITEQVAKLLYLNGNDHSLWRKLEDAAVAVKLEGRYDKEQILGAYLNSVYFGEGAYGVWRASRRYFGVSPRSLDLAQASMLAGLIQAPSAYDPFRDPALARAPAGRGAAGDGRRRLRDRGGGGHRPRSVSAPPRRCDASGRSGVSSSLRGRRSSGGSSRSGL